MSKIRIARVAIIVLIIASMFGFALRSSLTAAAADRTEKGDKRQPEQVINDLKETGQQLKGVLESPDALLDPAKRAEIAPRAIPPMKKLVSLFDELASVDERTKPQAMEAQRKLLAMLAMMGDEESLASIDKHAGEKNGAQWKA